MRFEKPVFLWDGDFVSTSQWERFLESYYERERLEEYQKNRILARPKTTKITVAVYLVILLVIIFGGGIGMFGISTLECWASILSFVLYIIGVAESFCRLVAIKIVECYQHYASEATRRKCKCVPSCSEYAILCLKKYELIYALLKIRKRLFVTCKGFDYILDNP